MADTTALPTAENQTPIMSDQSAGNGTGASTPVVVTSGSSRTSYADNVSTLNQANQNLTGAVNPNGDRTNVTADGYTFNGQNYVKQTRYDGNGNPYTVDVISGTANNGSTPNKNTPSSNNGTPANTGSSTDTTATQPVNPFAPNGDGSAVTGSTANTDGSQTVTYANGTTADFIHDANGNLQPKNAGSNTAGVTTGNMSMVDPSLRAEYDKNNAQLTQQASDAKTAVANAVATMQNDPAALAAASNIQRQFDVLIKQMQDKNSMLLGTYRTNGARSGMLQYANDMYSNFMSMEMDKATTRIGDLQSKEFDPINKSNQAYKDKDVKALDAATKEYNNVLKEKQKSLTDLNKLVNDAVKNNQNQAKLDAAASKQKITDDIRVSTSLGKTIAETIRKSGVTDPKQIDDYISGMAEQNGVSNPEILKNAYVKANQDADKLDLSAENTKNNIKNRDIRTGLAVTKAGKGGTGEIGGKLSSTELNQLGNTLQTGGTFGGRKYNGVGADGKYDPYLYSSHYTQLKTKVGIAAAQQFLSKYPPAKYLNPDNATNTELPEEIRNLIAAKTSSKSGGTPPPK